MGRCPARFGGNLRGPEELDQAAAPRLAGRRYAVLTDHRDLASEAQARPRTWSDDQTPLMSEEPIKQVITVNYTVDRRHGP